MRGFFLKKQIKVFSIFFSLYINSALFEIYLKQKLFSSHKNICFEAIQNNTKSKTVVWTEVCYQIFAGWEVQTMWN